MSKEEQALALEDRISKVDTMIEDMNTRFPGKLPPAVTDEWNATRSEVMRVVIRRAPPDTVTGAAPSRRDEVNEFLSENLKPISTGLDNQGRPIPTGGVLKALDTYGKATMSGFGQIGQTIGTGIEIAGRHMAMPGVLPASVPQLPVLSPEAAGKVQKAGEDMRRTFEYVNKTYYDFSKNIRKGKFTERLQDPNYWVGNIANMAPGLLASVAAGAGSAGVIGKVAAKYGVSTLKVLKLSRLGQAILGGATGGALEGSSTYQEMLDTGHTKEEAETAAFLMAGGSALLNAVSLDKMLKKLPPDAKAQLFGRVMTGATEAVTEWLEEPHEAISMEAAVKGPKALVIPETYKKAWEAVKSGVDVIGPSFILGALGGGGGPENQENGQPVVQPQTEPGVPPPGPAGAPPPGAGPAGSQQAPPPPGAGPQAGPYSWQRPNQEGPPPPPTGGQAPSPGVQDATRETPGVTPEQAQKMDTKGRFRVIPASEGNWTVYMNIGKDGNVDYFAHNPDIPNGPVDRIVQLVDGSKKLIQGAYKSNPAVITKLTGIPLTAKGTLRMIGAPKAEVGSQEMDIDGEKFVLIPDEDKGISGNMAAAFGVKKRDGNLWVPEKRAKALHDTMVSIKVDLEKKNSAEGKEPWQITQTEYWREGAGGKASEGRGTANYNHKIIVKKALAENKPVSSEVLADYPDLVKQAEGKAEATKPISPRMKNWKSIIVGKLSAEEAKDLSDAELRRAFKGATAPIQLFRNAKDLIASGALTEKDIVRETGKEPIEPAPKPQPIPVKSPDASTIINLHNAHLRMTLNQLEVKESKFKRDMVEYNEGSAPNDAKYKIVREGDKKYVVERTFGDKTEKIVGSRRGEFISQEDALVWTFQDYKLSNPGEPESKRENIFEKPMRESEEKARAVSDEVGKIFKRRDEALDEIEKMDFTILGGREGKGHFKQMVRRSTRPDEIADIVKQAKEASLKQAEIAEAEEKERQLNIEGRKRHIAEIGIKEKFLAASTVKERTDILKNENVKLEELGPLPAFEGKITRKKYSPESAAFLMTSEDELRPLLQRIHHNKNGNLEATDGHMLISIKDASDKSGETRDGEGNNIEGNFPEINKVIPKKKEVRNLGSFSLEEGLRITRQAQKFRVKDIRDYPIVKIEQGYYDTSYMGNVVEALYGLGYDKVNVSWKGIKDPLLFETDDGKITALVMPIRLDEGEQNYDWKPSSPAKKKTPSTNADAGGYAPQENESGQMEADFGGYAAEVGRYADEGTAPKSAIPLPELVKMARELLGGRFPAILKRLAGNFLGVFRSGLGGGIELKADIFKGHQILTQFKKEKLGQNEIDALTVKTGLPAETVLITQEWDKNQHGWIVKVFHIDPSLAAKVLAHEIGHAVDYLPEGDLSRGNILGRIGTLKKYMQTFLGYYPGTSFNPLSKADRERIGKEARKLANIDASIREEVEITPDEILSIWRDFAAKEKDPELNRYISMLDSAQKKSIVKEALKGKVADWVAFKHIIFKKIIKGTEYEKMVKAKYEQMIHEEAKKRQLFERDEIMDELKALTQKWKPFDPEANPKFTKYRYSSKELYADAISVLFNNPDLLGETAPTFRRAFFNWFNQKPQVKSVYESIQAFLGRSEEEIFKGRQADIGAMFKAAGERRIAVEAEKEKRAEGGSILGDLFKKLVDRDQPLLKRVREVQKKQALFPEENPRYSKEELDYVADAQYQYMRDVDEFVIKHAKAAGVTEEHLGTYLLLHRAGTERKYFANPLGYNETESKRQAGMLLKSLGVEGAARLKEAVARFHEIRKRHVIAMMKVSKMYSDDLMEHIEGNFGNYATFNVVKYLEDKHGVNTFTAAIKRQIGTFSEIENPLLSTVLKDIVMVRSMQRKMALDDLFNFMHHYFPQEIRDAEMKWDANLGGKTPAETQEGGWQTIMSMDHGKMKGYDLPEALAGVYDRAPRQASALIRLMGKAQTPWKNLVVSKNLAWMVWNLVRDFKKTYLANKEVGFWRLLGNYFKAVKDARLDVFANKSTSIVREMYENRALLQGRYFTASSDEPNAMMDRVMLQWGLRDPEYKNNVLKPFRLFIDKMEDDVERKKYLGPLAPIGKITKFGNPFRILRTLEEAGRFTERLGKIAGYRTLRETGLKPREIAHRVRGRVGSPNFYSRGEWFTVYNNLFVFSNAGMQGLRSMLEATRQTPGTVAFRTFALELVPKLMMRASQAGVLVAIAMALSDDDEDDPKVRFAKRMQAMMEKIPERDKANYICIPFGETAAGKVVYMVIPHDFNGQALGGILWTATGGDAFKVEDLMDYIQGGLPYSGLNPHLQFFVDMGLYSTGRNPYDSWTGKEMVPEDKWNAGGKIRLKSFLEQEWNRLGGSYIHRFKYDDLEKVQSEYEKILDLPLAGQALKRFVRVSDRGLSDKFREEMDKDEQAAARRRLEINDAIVKDLNETEEPGRGSAKELYNKLRADGVQVGEFHDFWTKYQTRMNYRENNAYSYSLQKARTKAQKQRILSEELGTEIAPGRVKAATTLAKLRVKKRTEGLTPEEQTNLEKLEQLFKKGAE